MCSLCSFSLSQVAPLQQPLHLTLRGRRHRLEAYASPLARSVAGTHQIELMEFARNGGVHLRHLRLSLCL
jgi:hypothetical protein